MGNIKKNRWKEAVAPQGRKVLTHAHHLASSCSKLLRFILQDLVDQCFRLFVRIKEKIYVARQKSIRHCQRVYVLTKRTLCNVWYRFVGICYRTYSFAKATGTKTTIQCRNAYIATRDLLISSWNKLVHSCHEACMISWQALCKTTLRAYNFLVTAWKKLKEVGYRAQLTTSMALYTWAFGIAARLHKKSTSVRSSTCTKLIQFTDQCFADYCTIKETMRVSWQWIIQQCVTLGITAWQNSLHLYKRAIASTLSICQHTKNFAFSLWQKIVQAWEQGTRIARVVSRHVLNVIATAKAITITGWFTAKKQYHQAVVASRQIAHLFAQKFVLIQSLFYTALHHFGELCKQDSQAVVNSVNTACLRCKKGSISSARKMQQMCKTGWVMSSRFIFAAWHSFKTLYLHLRVRANNRIVKISNKSLRQYRRTLSRVKRNYVALKRFVKVQRRNLALKKHQIYLYLQSHTRQLITNGQHQYRQTLESMHRQVAASRVFAKQKILAVREKRRAVAAWAQHSLTRYINSAQNRGKLFVHYLRSGLVKRRPAPEPAIIPPVVVVDRDVISKLRGHIHKLKLLLSKKSKIDSREPENQQNLSFETASEVKAPHPVRNPRWQFAMSASLALSLAMGTYLYMSSIPTEDLMISTEGGLSTPPLAAIVPSEPPAPLIVAAAEPVKTHVSMPQKKGGYSFWPKRVTLRHVEGWGEGVSFGTDYSTCALFISPDYRVGKVMPILDLRGHRFDNNRYAANVGLAGRYIPESADSFCQILGFNAFYDWREGHKGNYNQIGVGLEVLGKRWDFRANGYAPIGKTKRKTKCVFDDYVGDYFAIHRECEFTSYGFNAEIGYYAVRSQDFFLYTAVGPYYLVRRCHDKTRGGMFRIRPQYKDYLALDASVSYDSVFKTVYQAQIILYLPLYQLSKKGNQRPCNLTDYQIYQPIERYEVMPLGRRSCWQTNF